MDCKKIITISSPWTEIAPIATQCELGAILNECQSIALKICDKGVWKMWLSCDSK
jgi:hypothetical protein